MAEKKVRVWDLPVRLFHWTLVILLATSYFSGRAGGDWMKLHFWSGYAILTLLLFRIAWGFVGSTTARFSHFVKGPVAWFVYLRDLATGRRTYDVGHNPVGGIMVLALIFAVLAQAVAGLFAADTDLGTVSGPLANAIPDKWVDRLTSFHTSSPYTCWRPSSISCGSGRTWSVPCSRAASRWSTSPRQASPRRRSPSPRAGWRYRC
jgi:cytochrome b